MWKVANAIVFLVFLLSALVQVNDPDPLLWIALYLAAAAMCLADLLRRERWWLPALLCAGCVVWAATIAPRVIGQVPFMSMFGAFEMQNIGIEESREMYGLLMIAVWMAVLALRARRVRVG